MAFDPKEFLRVYGAAPSQPPGAQAQPFDPKAFLQQTQPAAPAEEVGKLESFGRGALRGATFDFADEISGAVESTAGSLGLTDVDKTYEQARDESRANFDAAEQANPLTSLAGNLGGAAATMLIPGLGEANMVNAGRVLAKAPMVGKLLQGSKIAQAGLLGAGMGAVQGAGASTADTAAGVFGDSAEGAAVGGVTGGVFQGGMQLAGAAAKGTGRYLHNAFEPTKQRLEAIGATPAAIEKAGGFAVLKDGMDEAVSRKVFTNANGDPVTPVTIFKNADAVMDMTAAEMHRLVEGQAYPKIPLKTFNKEFLEPLNKMAVDKGLTAHEAAADQAIAQLYQDVVKTDGSVSAIWKLKKKLGAETNWREDPPLVDELYQEANRLLNDIQVNHMNSVSELMGGQTGSDLAAQNKIYANLSKVWPIMRKSSEKYLLKGDTGSNIRISEQIKGAGVGGALGSMLGVPGMGVALGATSALGGAAMRSVSGRLARAKVGEMMGLGARGAAQKAEGDAAAQAAGLIPRTLQGTREWLQKNMQMVAQMPGMAQVADQIMKLPDPAAELLVRATLPVVAQFVAPSQYESEFNGKISTPQDRITARRVITAQGLPPSVAAYHVSVLNKSGTLQQYHYAKPESGDYGDELLNFNRRLTEMGY